jgi:hypothetical protein
MTLRIRFLNCRPRETFDGARGPRSRDVENAQPSMARGDSGIGTWHGVLKNALTLVWCLSEALYPGLASPGIVAVQHFYDEHEFRPTVLFRILRNALLAANEPKRLCKDATPLLKVHSKGSEVVENAVNKASPLLRFREGQAAPCGAELFLADGDQSSYAG